MPVMGLVSDASKTVEIAQGAHPVEVDAMCSYTSRICTPASAPILHWRQLLGTRSFSLSTHPVGIVVPQPQPQELQRLRLVGSRLGARQLGQPLQQHWLQLVHQILLGCSRIWQGVLQAELRQQLRCHKHKSVNVCGGSVRIGAGLGCFCVWQSLQA